MPRSTITEYRELLELSVHEDADFYHEDAGDAGFPDEDCRKTSRQAGDDLEEAARFVATRPLDDPHLLCFAALMKGEPADDLWENRSMLSIHLWEALGMGWSIPPATLVCYMMASYLMQIESAEVRMRQQAVEAL